MNPSTLRTVSADFVTTIVGITPDYPLQQDKPWTPVKEMDDVPGTLPRLFHGVWGYGVPSEDGIYGNAIEYDFPLSLFVNYRGFDEDTPAEMIQSDGRQLWIALQERVDPVVPGLVEVTYEGFDVEEDEPGHVWGSHTFLVQILLSHET